MRRVFPVVVLMVVCLLSSCRKKHQADHYDVWGLDVSKHQSAINWDRVFVAQKPHFVFVKATEGSLIVDPNYQRNAAQLDKNEVLWGAYHFFGHRTSGSLQAENFIRTAKLKKGNLVPVLDIEMNRLMTDPKRSAKEAKVFCEVIKRKYGQNPIIYCSNLFYHQYLKKDFPQGKFVLWIADYRGEPSDLNWKFWQHTDSYKLRGVDGFVDRNVFVGTIEELNKYVIK